MSQLRAPSLRQRFLVAPLLGLVLLSLLVAAFTHELERQNALLTHVVDEDMVTFERSTRVFIDLSEEHVGLFDLLNSAPQSDEETLYDNAKQRLFAIHDATRKLRETVPAAHGGGASAVAQRGEMLELIEAYHRAAIAAVEMTTLNVALAPREITLANQRFGAMNRAFEKLLDTQLDEHRQEASDRIARNRARTVYVALGGISLAVLLLALSVGLSRLLSRSLEMQIRLLGELGDPAEADTKAGGGDEVERIGRGIAAFRRTQVALRESEKHLRAAFDQAGVGMALRDIDPLNSRWLRVNQKLCDILGYTREELMQLTPLDLTPAEDRDLTLEYGEKLLKGEITSHSREKRYVRKDGRIIWANITLTAVSGPDGRQSHILSVIEDITGRKEAEESVKRLSRVRAVLSGINSAIVRIPSRQALFDEACRIAVEHGGFGMVWIGLFDPKTLDVTPAAWAGFEADDEWAALKSTTRDIPQGQGSIGRAIREKRPVVVNNMTLDASVGGLRRKEAIERGYRSAIALPLLSEEDVIGTFALFAKEVGYFNDAEVTLLTELAGDISFALEHMARQEKIEKLARIRAVSSGINAAIVRIRQRRALLEEVCRIAREQGRFEMVWIAEIDPDKQQVEAVAWTGFTAEAARGVTWAAIGAAPATMDSAIKTRKMSVRNEIGQQLVAGTLRHLAAQQGCHSSVCLPVVVDDRAVALISLFAAGRDFFDRDELALLDEVAADVSFALQSITQQEKVEYLSHYDTLTGLPNRALFLERLGLQLRIAERSGTKAALFLGDVKRFRFINESLGRRAGDALLCELAVRARNTWPDPNNVARIAANSFAGSLGDLKDETEIAHVLEKALTEVTDSPFAIEGNELAISMTAGIAVFPADGADPDTLFRNAEAALKQAKASGERYLFYQAGMNARVADILLLENKLRRALDNEQFVLHYQPKIELASGRICGLEALIRWNDPETGLVPPVKFIPLLEETGMIVEVGRWAIRKALEDYSQWHKQGLQPPRIAVNVSPIQLRQKDFVDVTRNAISAHAAGSHGLDLEITESLIMEDIEGNIAKLRVIKDMGVNIAIDDFGTGYSSLGYLAKLPVDALKIDRSFILKMTGDSDSMTIVSTIISLAHSLNLKVIAEGVDAEEQRKYLRLLKCDEMQGYLFSKPLPAAGIVTMLGRTSNLCLATSA